MRGDGLRLLYEMDVMRLARLGMRTSGRGLTRVRRMGRMWFRGAGLLLGLVGCGRALAAERPVAAIPLEALGAQAVAGGKPVAAGSTVATVNWAGDHHVLVTFPVRRLMKRMEDGEPEDEDRTVEAVLVDVPSGTVAARTSWRLHDGGQYLWDLGRGRFMLRVRERLEVFAPLAHLSEEHPFEERRLLNFDRRRIVGILVSAERDLLTVETIERRPPPVKGAPAAESRRDNEGPVDLNFYRLEGGNGEVEVVGAGRVVSRTGAIEIPMTRDGYLDATKESKGTWAFDYVAHSGKTTELSPFDTSCFPRAKFVSRSEFVAFGCKGSADKVMIGGFDMKGREMWQQNFFESFVYPTFSYAPEAGRFALSRALLPGTASTFAGMDIGVEALTGQDIQVMQMGTGKQLFHLTVMPVQRAGQNFSLAADGSALAVIRAGTLEIYRMPGLSGKDKTEVAGARGVEIERASGPIRLPTRSKATAMATPEPAEPERAEEKAVAPAVKRPVEVPVNVGDATGDEPRKAPTLYGAGDSPATH